MCEPVLCFHIMVKKTTSCLCVTFQIASINEKEVKSHSGMFNAPTSVQLSQKHFNILSTETQSTYKKRAVQQHE